MLLRLAYLGVTNTLAMLRLLPMSDHAKDVEILALRHQISVLERQLHGERPQFTPADRAFLAALLHQLPRDVLGRLRLLVRPDTILRWVSGEQDFRIQKFAFPGSRNAPCMLPAKIHNSENPPLVIQ